MKKVIISSKVDEEVRSKLIERANAENKSLNQLIGEVVRAYLGIPTTQPQVTVDKSPSVTTTSEVSEPKESMPKEVCPLCDAPLVYVKGGLLTEEKIKCSNPVCDTNKAFSRQSLCDLMGEQKYLRLLNLWRRKTREKAPQESTDEDEDLFGW